MNVSEFNFLMLKPASYFLVHCNATVMTLAPTGCGLLSPPLRVIQFGTSDSLSNQADLPKARERRVPEPETFFLRVTGACLSLLLLVFFAETLIKSV